MTKYTNIKIIKKVFFGCFFLVIIIFISFFLYKKYFYNNFLKDRTYLIALMNTDEKKPDGGFFGSYIIVNGTGNSVSYSFFDSYYPQTIKNIKVKLPQWFKPVMGIDNIGFLGVNMLGFTNIDGKNIVEIYEKTFNKRLDGVIFIKSSLFTHLNNNFQRFIRKQEFQNATINLIKQKKIGLNIKKGNENELIRKSPKILYFNDMENLLTSFDFVKIFVNGLFHIKEILENGFVRIYLNKDTFDKNLYNKLNILIKKNNLTLLKSGNNILSFDYNLGFNKIDYFVKKTLKIFSGTNLIYFTNKDIIKTQKKDFFQKGVKYSTEIIYEINIPKYYFDYIKELEKQFKIQLTDRERTILSINPQFYTRGVVYFPFDINILNKKGDYIYLQDFNIDFGKGIVYDLVGKGNNFRKRIYFQFKLK